MEIILETDRWKILEYEILEITPESIVVSTVTEVKIHPYYLAYLGGTTTPPRGDVRRVPRTGRKTGKNEGGKQQKEGEAQSSLQALVRFSE